MLFKRRNLLKTDTVFRAEIETSKSDGCGSTQAGEVDLASDDISDPAESFSSGRVFLYNVLACVGLLLAPIIVVWAYGVERFYQLSGADPFMYIGYAFNTVDLIERFGYPYYAVRFGLILTSSVFVEVFGADGGYLILRWLLSVIVVGAMFVLLQRRYRWEAGALACALLLLSPTYIRTVMTMYSTSVGVPAIGAALALVLLPDRGRRTLVYRLAAGLLVGLAVSSNPFAVLPAAAMLGVWMLFRLQVDWLRALSETAAISAGVLAVTLTGVVVYGVSFGRPDIFTPSLSAAVRLSSAVSPDKEPGLFWLDFSPEIWLAPIASALLLLTLLRAKRAIIWAEWCIALAPAAMWAGYAIHTFVLGSNTLQIYFYSAYMIGPTVLALATTVAVADEHWARRFSISLWVAGISIVLIAPFAWAYFARELSVWSLNGLVPLVLTAIGLGWFARRSVTAMFGVLAIVCVLPLVVTVGTPRNVPLADGKPWRQSGQYHTAFFNYDDISMDLYGLAAKFSSAMPRTSVNPGSLVFWVPGGDYGAGLMQWTYLGPYSRLLQPASPAPYPELDGSSIASLTERTPRYLVVMASNEAVVAEGVAAITELDIETVGINHLVLREGAYGVYVSLIEFVPDSCDLDHQGEEVFWSLLPVCPSS